MDKLQDDIAFHAYAVLQQYLNTNAELDTAADFVAKRPGAERFLSPSDQLRARRRVEAAIDKLNGH